MNDWEKSREQLIRGLAQLRQEVEEWESKDTRRQQTEDELATRERLYAKAEEIARFGHWERNFVKDTAAWSSGIFRIFDLDQEQFQDPFDYFLSLIHPVDRERVKSLMDTCLKTGSAIDIEYRIIGADGAERYVHSVGEVFNDESGKAAGLIGTLQDITERKRAEEKVNAYQRQLRSLESELVLSEERERRRIAQDLHDSIGQVLAFAKIKLSELRVSPDPTDIGGSLDEIYELVDQMILDVRTLSFELSPPVLYDLGCKAAVEWLAEQLTEEHGIAISVKGSAAPQSLHTEISILLFRGVRELLLNAVRHAQAHCIEVSFFRKRDHIQVAITDDGIGMDRSLFEYTGHTPSGFGLFKLRERIAHLGGDFQIESAPGCGTKIIMEMPLHYKEGTWDREI